VLVGAILLVMELILLRRPHPGHLVAAVQRHRACVAAPRARPGTARNAVVERADRWYAVLFVSPGLVETSYRITLPSEADVARAGALSPLAGLPLWSWVRVAWR
jgi:hypothetical protein